MEIMEVNLPNSKKKVEVVIQRKKMKSCRLKAYPTQELVFAGPLSVPKEWIEQFLNDKAVWIEKKLEIFSQTTGYASTTEIHNGQSIKMLGEDIIIGVTRSNKEAVIHEGKTIHICCLDVNDQIRLIALFEKWWRREALRFIETRVDALYPIIRKYGKSRPKVRLRKMKTLWGSCSVKKTVVTFNQYLFKASPAYIDYVILHELIHFLYPNHSKQFYDFLSIYMPDWKERKKVLDMEVVHGL